MLGERKRMGFMDKNEFVHAHVCLVCGKEWECGCDFCFAEGMSEATCLACCKRLQVAQERMRYAGIHMHSCPKCGRGWDCSNECGVVDGSLSKATCGLCMEHVVAVGTLAAPTVIEHMPHSHICMIANHRWECLDAECGFETMMNPEKMRHLECPECFVFTP